ncbi:ABC transporter ATP-binding protein [Azospirillum himalayense]|uniref:ABC transporter ATP-binding protein n=1 Tax=Azospirillum himalayense TaxID=654847 RepID=A0ABW0G8S5_9PROT
MTAILDIGGFSLSFRTAKGIARVLDRVDLTVRPGEIVGLVGESGCGKTTLVRAILGALPEPVAKRGGGHILLDGVDTLSGGKAAQSMRGRDVTFVPQDPFASFNPLFRVGTQIRDLMRWRGPGPEGSRRDHSRQTGEAAVHAMLDAVQLPAGVLVKYPHELSGGQRQRVLIAMALLPQPRIIIADEPTTALDSILQAQILSLLRRVAVERGVAVLFATHDLGAAWEICDRVTVLYAGQTVEIGPREPFFRAPRHPYTRMLLESMPEPDRALRVIPGGVPNPLAPPEGCRFNPRCPRATAVCGETRPPLSSAAHDHLVACHHPWTDAEQVARG